MAANIISVQRITEKSEPSSKEMTQAESELHTVSQ